MERLDCPALVAGKNLIMDWVVGPGWRVKTCGGTGLSGLSGYFLVLRYLLSSFPYT